MISRNHCLPADRQTLGVQLNYLSDLTFDVPCVSSASHAMWVFCMLSHFPPKLETTGSFLIITQLGLSFLYYLKYI